MDGHFVPNITTGPPVARAVKRIATRPFEGPQRRFGLRRGGLHLDAIAIDYDDIAWQRSFLAQWPAGSDAHASYWSRISGGTDHTLDDALRVESISNEA